MLKTKNIIQEMRLYQWIKNLLIFTPLIFVNKLFDLSLLGKTTIAFLSFSLMASAVYVLNDIFDLPKDRLHPKKKERPLASGKINLLAAKILLMILFVASALLGWLVNGSFIFILFFYFFINIIYSYKVKNIAILDLIFIAVMYLIRVYAGAAAINVPVSNWLLLTTLFVALFIATAKRRAEIINVRGDNNLTRKVLEEYNIQFLDYLLIITNIATIIFYALYTMIRGGFFVWSIFFVVYAMLRYLWLVLKQGVGEEPEKILVKDKPIVFSILGWGIFITLVLYL